MNFQEQLLPRGRSPSQPALPEEAIGRALVYNGTVKDVVMFQGLEG
jgi:hypothetical protein